LTEIVQIRTIVTTNYDKLFEAAYGNDIVILTQDEHVPTYALDDRVKLYKIHGDFSSPTKMILRKSDYERFYSNHVDESPLWNQIKSMLSASSILFIGYSMQDWDFSLLFNQVQKYLGAYQNEHFFVAPNIPEYQINKLASQGIAAISMTAEELIPQIHREVKRHILEDVQRGWV
ncbi:SIR2 family NAD-dependent protein deacylase, partial [Alicyclobacillus shizuokensis]|uniref:SIR2 family NAD-dependent protein deacylase n=1 Tax=Alicyclobacillus shizuokensis TaxID=392014 RepID=UPI000B00E78A